MTGDDPRPPRVLFTISFGDSQLVDLTEQDDYEFPHPLLQWVMPVLVLHTVDGETTDAHVLGTCFAIAPWLAVTAKHVLTLGGPLDETGNAPPGIGIAIVYVSGEQLPGTPAGAWGGLLHVNQVVMCAEADLALLRFSPPTIDGRPPTFLTVPLTADPPPPGSPMLFLGYPEGPSGFTPPRTVTLEQKVHASRGVVQDLHIPFRDRSRLAFPVVAGDFPSEFGMSGGPVVDGEGHVCGVLSSSFEPSSDGDGVWTSFAALLAYLFAMKVEMDLDGVVDAYTIHELAERGVIATDGSHRKLQLHARPDGKIDLFWPR
jgi:Trypsin-like peptidase domain